MCGRFAQCRTTTEYLDALSADVLDFQTGLETSPIGRYNAAPGTRLLPLNRRYEGLHLDPVMWGYLPFWARQAKRPPMINGPSRWQRAVRCSGKSGRAGAA